VISVTQLVIAERADLVGRPLFVAAYKRKRKMELELRKPRASRGVSVLASLDPVPLPPSSWCLVVPRRPRRFPCGAASWVTKALVSLLHGTTGQRGMLPVWC
jgi:hypothetical protein